MAKTFVTVFHKTNLFQSERYISIQFLFDGNESNRFRVIIHKMTQDSGGNVNDRSIVSVICSSLNRGDPKKFCRFLITYKKIFFLVERFSKFLDQIRLQREENHSNSLFNKILQF